MIEVACLCVIGGHICCFIEYDRRKKYPCKYHKFIIIFNQTLNHEKLNHEKKLTLFCLIYLMSYCM